MEPLHKPSLAGRNRASLLPRTGRGTWRRPRSGEFRGVGGSGEARDGRGAIANHRRSAGRGDLIGGRKAFEYAEGGRRAKKPLGDAGSG